jgi:MFS family permease
MTASKARRDATLSRRRRLGILIAAFLGWFFAGYVMAIGNVAGRPALRSMGLSEESEILAWMSRLVSAFLLGAAAGGLAFGWLGDRIGRAKAMAASILWYSAFTGVACCARTPAQLVVLRFVACLGVGGMWPNGIALVAEAWSDVSRPFLAGVIGASANFGFVLLAVVARTAEVTLQSWRWVFAYGATPGILGFLALVAVAESPSWLRSQVARTSGTALRRSSVIAEVFRRPLLGPTVTGILLSAIPFLGNWGGANWVVTWSDEVGERLDRPGLKAEAQLARSLGGAIGSLIGGWLASLLGRRKAYFLISLASLGASAHLFWLLEPGARGFLTSVFVLGFFGTVYFGWLPLYLPELFPTHVRATGSGVTFNFGRILTALAVLLLGEGKSVFAGDYARVGQVTALVYVIGMVVICFAPDTSKRRVAD